MENFVIRAYGKGELAQCYSPHVTPAAACRRMMAWIKMQPSLVEALHAAGYNEKSRNFTPAQVQLIVTALGEP
ncbi:MAG: DUF4248 domain-containing protein [Bacteroidales bacterium]|nr:DUF4248 domain-containing protein [Bacteroidales bacterium]